MVTAVAHAFTAVDAALRRDDRLAVADADGFHRTELDAVDASLACVSVDADAVKIGIDLISQILSSFAGYFLLVQQLTVIVTVVPCPRTVSISIVSEFFFMLGRPMPAPKPRFLASSEAVDQPACIALLTSLMPGPLSIRIIRILSGKISTLILPPSAWMTILISPSYMQMATLRMTAESTPAIRSFFLTSPEASPARV